MKYNLGVTSVYELYILVLPAGFVYKLDYL